MPEINVNLKDQTEDGRFSQSNTADDINKGATKTKTQTASVSGSTPKTTNVSSGLMRKVTNNSPLGGMGGMVGGALSTQTIALTALSVATKMYKEWRKENQRVDEVRELRLRAGGDRSQSNKMNQRVGLITGLNSGGSSTYVRR